MGSADKPKDKKDLAYLYYAEAVQALKKENQKGKDEICTDFFKAATFAKEKKHPDIAAKAFYQLAELHRQDHHLDLAGIFYKAAYTEVLQTENTGLRQNIISAVEQCLQASAPQSQTYQVTEELLKAMKNKSATESVSLAGNAVTFFFPGQKAGSTSAEDQSKLAHSSPPLPGPLHKKHGREGTF